MRDVLPGWEAGRLSRLEAALPAGSRAARQGAAARGGAISSAVLVEEEGTRSSFLGLSETIAGHGLPRYADRTTHCFHTPEAGAKVA